MLQKIINWFKTKPAEVDNKTLIEEADALLAELGTNIEDICDTLLALDMKGIPHRGDACPIARYLSSELGLAVASTAHGSYLRPGVWVAHPAIITELIYNFDAGKLKALEI